MKQTTYSRRKFFEFLVTTLSILLASCKKFVEVPLPVDQLPTEFVFKDDNTALQALNGIYSEMMNNAQQFCSSQTTLFAGMCADELYYYTPGVADEFVNNEISRTSHESIESYFWNPAYRYIYAANKCIEGAQESKSLSPSVKQMVIGESKFVRAFCYYYLASLFGDVPLVTSSNYQVSQSLPRMPKASIYSQIINDLKDAEDSLSPDYPASERIRPNKMAAIAMLGRIYLETQDWVNAESASTSVITSGTYSLTNDLNEVFLVNSNETIWQLKPVMPSFNTWEGFFIIPSSSDIEPTYLITNSLIDAFEPNDQRKLNWVKSYDFASQTFYYPYKYKVISSSVLTEYYVVLRMAEQYLIRAEARAQQNNISGSQSDINFIRNRAGLSNTTVSDKTTCFTAIEQERRVELFAEWGHRWFDLKRTGQATAVLGQLKSATWQPTDELWPIPQSQINLNPSLTQNAGY
jgi:starch-binding outer membrane protein, SusD/RagB family